MTKSEIMPVPWGKSQSSVNCEKNIGTNTDEKMFSYLKEPVVEKIIKATSSVDESKSSTNLKNKKSDHVLKTEKRSPVDEKTHSNIKIDKKRYKDITATIESLSKEVETKILSNSLFSSIQDVVMKNAPKEAEKHDERHKPPQEKRDCRSVKTTKVREHDPNAEHGEGKVILYLDKHRCKPSFSNVVKQTDPATVVTELPILAPMLKERVSPVNRKRNYSVVSISSDESKPENRVLKPKELRLKRTEIKEKKPGEIVKPITPPLRKPTISKSSNSSYSYRYGFVTYQRARVAWLAVDASRTFPQYDVGFGGRRAFCRQSYADLDGLDVKYAESAYHGEPMPQPTRRNDDMSFERMLSEMKKKLGQSKKERKV